MNAKAAAVLATIVAWLLFSSGALAQGFAGLGSDADGFTIPHRGTRIVFPRDHGQHADFRIEWWYITANLQTSDGTKLGAQWTLFRSALSPGERPTWSSPQVWMGHAAVTTKSHHYVAERLGRGGVGQAGVREKPFEAWIDDWRMESREASSRSAMQTLDLTANGQDFSYRLTLDAQGPMVLHGEQGYSVKSSQGQASYYYSQPFYHVDGIVELDGRASDVIGKAWLDREWSSQPLAPDQSGWDWFSLHLASGEKVMAFRLRDGAEGFTSATWITADGKSTPLAADDVTLEPLKTARVAGKVVPVEWRVRIPSRALDIRTRALNDQAWMATSTPYWEGPIEIEGSTTGQGYLEMTGY